MEAKDVVVGTVVDVCARMPLAEATLTLWRYVFDADRLNGLWQQQRGRCYDKVITFPIMTHLVADALLHYGGSGRRSFEKNQQAGTLDSSVAAAFGKLGRLPLALSHGLLHEGTVALRELFPPTALRQLPASLQAFAVYLCDGKALKKVAKRLKALRGVGGGLLGGKALAMLHWQTSLVTVLQTHPDGDASEKPLLAGALEQLAADELGPCLFVGDRAYCGLVQIGHFTKRPGDHFVVRYQSLTSFTPDPSRAEQTGLDSAGRVYRETWGWLGRADRKDRRYVRRIQLTRPEEEDLLLITDLVDGDAYPAADVLWLYRERWGIERVFQKVTEVFGLERLIGSTPQACIFQFAFCLLLYNLIQLLTSYVAQARQCDVEALSQEKLFDDVQRELTAWNVVLTPEQTLQRFADCLPAAELQVKLSVLLAPAWSETWWKARPQPNRRTSPRKGKRGHASVYRLLHPADYPKPKRKARAKRC